VVSTPRIAARSASLAFLASGNVRPETTTKIAPRKEARKRLKTAGFEAMWNPLTAVIRIG
jgi:hypothetical protein